MLSSRKRDWCLIAAAACWAILFPSKQKILFPIASVLHGSNFWRVLIHYELQLCFLSTCFSGTTHYTSVLCVCLLDSPSPLFIVLSVIPLSFLFLCLAKSDTDTPFPNLPNIFFTEFINKEDFWVCSWDCPGSTLFCKHFWLLSQTSFFFKLAGCVLVNLKFA